MDYDSPRAADLLKRGTGRRDARFREGQEEAIRHLVEGYGRQLLIQKTGWGKSFVYFIRRGCCAKQVSGRPFSSAPCWR